MYIWYTYIHISPPTFILSTEKTRNNDQPRSNEHPYSSDYGLNYQASEKLLILIHGQHLYKMSF